MVARSLHFSSLAKASPLRPKEAASQSTLESTYDAMARNFHKTTLADNPFNSDFYATPMR